jgi:uncharacterized protein YbjT (DUF2867 family)
MSELQRKTHLFSLRIWSEPLGGDQVEWRGRLQVLPGGEASYFHGLTGLLSRLEDMLGSIIQEEDPLIFTKRRQEMILVVGATGSLGGRITRSLLAQGKQVSILDRKNPLTEILAQQGRANTVQSLVDAGAKPVYGDLKDPASLAQALQGVDTVITTATATQREGEDNIQSVDLQGNLNLIEAAKAAGVRRFIFTSVQNCFEGHPIELFHIKAACESALMKSGMEYIIIKPSIFMEIWVGMMVGLPLMNQAPVTLIGQGDHRHNFISEADVAAFIVAALDNPKASNQTLIIGGPDSFTWTEVFDRANQALGGALQVQYLPPGSEVPFLPPAANILITGMETYESFVDMSELVPAFGIEPTTLDTYIQRTFVPRSQPARPQRLN